MFWKITSASPDVVGDTDGIAKCMTEVEDQKLWVKKGGMSVCRGAGEENAEFNSKQNLLKNMLSAFALSRLPPF